MQHPRRKILFLPSWFPNKKHPENGDFILRHARAAATVADVYIIFLSSDHSAEEFYQVENEEDSGVQIKRVFYRGSSFKPLQFLQYIYVYLKSIKDLRKRIGRIDLAHVHVIYPAGFIALLLKILGGLPYLVTEHWTGHLQSNSQHDNPFRRFASRIIARNAGLVSTVSVDLAEALRAKRMGRVFRLLYNVVDTSAFKIADRAADPALKLIHVSSLKDEQKNISGMLRVLKRLEKEEDVRLDIVGDGDPTAHIEYARELGISEKNLKFHSKMPHAELSGFMAEHDAFLLFSNSENLPCVMVEAMACGLPVISSKVGGIAEHLDKSRGILLDAKDEEALFNSILHLRYRLASFDKTAIRQYAEAHFSVEAVAKQFDVLYEEILTGRSYAS